MKLRLLILILLGLTTSLDGQGAASPLEGCADPNAIAKALTKLRESNWRDISLMRLRSIWPTELDALDCDADTCRSVWSKDRIINGRCQCCATFFFKPDSNERSPRVEKLSNIVLNYSAQQRDDLVAVARQFAAASGLGQAEAATVGNDSVQNFHWETAGRNGRELSAIELHFTHQGRLWELYFNIGQNIPL